MTTNKKKRISDDKFRELLIKELANPESKAHLKTNFYELLQTKYSISKSRALELHDAHYSDIISARNEKLEGESLEMEAEALKAKIGDKNEHAKRLLSQIDKMQETISELEEVKVGAVKVANQIVVTTQSDVTKAKNEIRAHYSEIRAILKQIGDWYGFNAPKQLDHTTKGESLVKPKMQKVRVIIKEHNPSNNVK